MKLPAGRVEAFLRRPDREIRAVLLYGPDAGLVRERADTIARTVCPDLRDAFLVAEIPAATLAADPARLADEAAQISLMGGRRVVRVRDAGDGVATIFGRFLADARGDAMVIAEAGDLPGRSSLRRVFDEAPVAAAIGCYPDGPRELALVIRDSLGTHRVTASRDAVAFLVEHLGGDRLLTRAELDKLALYAGDGGQIELDDARLAVGDSAAISLDDAVLAAADGDAAVLERALGRVFQEGESPVTVIRALLRHLQRLHLFAARIAAGATAAEVLRSARPPVFFRHEDRFKRQLGIWNAARLAPLLGLVGEAEFRMKLTGLPAETICRQALLTVAQAVRRPDR